VRNTPRILAALGVVMLIVIIWRVVTGGPIGPKSYAFIAVTVVVWIATVVMSRRTPGATVPPRV
jgi:hypothetical protein